MRSFTSELWFVSLDLSLDFSFFCVLHGCPTYIKGLSVLLVCFLPQGLISQTAEQIHLYLVYFLFVVSEFGAVDCL